MAELYEDDGARRLNDLMDRREAENTQQAILGCLRRIEDLLASVIKKADDKQSQVKKVHADWSGMDLR